MNPIIALVGLCGTGKSEVGKFLEAKGYLVVYFGGTVVNEVKKQGLEVTPSNEKKVREALREQYGMAAMAHINLPNIKQALSEGRHVVIDGLYSMGELDVLNAEFGDKLKLLAIHAPKTLRYQRLAVRPVRPMTAQQVDERDMFEVKNLDKAGPIALAHVHVVNDCDKVTLLTRLEQAYQSLLNT